MTALDYIVNGGSLAVLLLTAIQISPIKINPWSALAKFVGRAINHEVLEKVDKLDNEVKGLKFKVSENVAIQCRARILRFGDEVLHSTRHTKDHFDQILRDITSYEQYCEEHPEFENNITEITSSRIKEIYKNCLSDNDFL